MASRPTFDRALLVVGLVLATAGAAGADIGVIVHEPVSALGFFTRVGHAGTYLSNICPDGSPIKMRLCRPGESGSVVIRSSALSENEDYDWAIVPFEEYMHGFGSLELAPLFGTRDLQHALEGYDFGPVFARAFTTSTAGALPEGHWKAALATRFDRSIYVFSVETTAFASDGRLSCQLLESFERDGEFYVDRAGPWMRLQLGEGEWRATGLSRSHILSGDPRVAALILAAVFDYHLHQPEARREDIQYVDGLFTLLRQASGAVERRAR